MPYLYIWGIYTCIHTYPYLYVLQSWHLAGRSFETTETKIRSLGNQAQCRAKMWNSKKSNNSKKYLLILLKWNPFQSVQINTLWQLIMLSIVIQPYSNTSFFVAFALLHDSICVASVVPVAPAPQFTPAVAQCSRCFSWQRVSSTGSGPGCQNRPIPIPRGL